MMSINSRARLDRWTSLLDSAALGFSLMGVVWIVLGQVLGCAVAFAFALSFRTAQSMILYNYIRNRCPNE